MDKPKYYTDEEMIQRMQELANEGKHLVEICKDPRCKPDIKEKLLALDKLGWMPLGFKYTGNQNIN